MVKQATGDVFVRMDVHCEYAPDYVRKCVETLERTGADNVGGAQRAKAQTFFQRALCAALTSPLGVGGAKYRSADAEGFVDTVFLGAFRRRVFETVGLWDPGAITNEDAELNQRILDSGGQIYLSRDIVVHYFPRDSFQTLAKQYYKYGRGRARTLLKLGSFPNLRPLAPFAMVVGAAALVALPPLWPIAPLAFATYALATGAEAVRVAASSAARRDPAGVGDVPGAPRLARRRLRRRARSSTCASPTGPHEPERMPQARSRCAPCSRPRVVISLGPRCSARRGRCLSSRPPGADQSTRNPQATSIACSTSAQRPSGNSVMTAPSRLR